jgi:transcription antitermination factor NusG
MDRWYTVHTKPNAEYQTATALQERGIETYIPELESPNRANGRSRKPFFPCYLFVRVDFEVTGLSQLQWTPGLRRVVAFDDRPVPLEDEVITLMRRKLDGVGADGQSTHNFHPGETVRITDGPLQGMLAIFEGPSTPAERVQVLLTFLGHASRAHVPVFDLEKAAPMDDTPAPRRPRRTRGSGRRIKYS